jgi:hypothetical protein
MQLNGNLEKGAISGIILPLSAVAVTVGLIS